MFAANSDNPWIAEIRSASRTPRAILTLAIAIAICAVIDLGVGLMGGSSPPIVAGLLAAAAMLVAAVVAMRAQGRTVFRREPFGGEATLGGLAFGFGGFCAAAAVASVAGAVGSGGAIGSPSLIVPVLAALGLSAAQALAQETFFRGWLQPVLCARWGAWPGVVLAALVYGAFNLALGAHGILAVANLLLMGSLLGILALRSGGLAAPVAAHFAWWGAQDLVLGPGGHSLGFLDLRLQGAPIWSGDGDSMTGSLAMTVVLLVLLVTLVSAPSARDAPQLRAGPTK